MLIFLSAIPSRNWFTVFSSYSVVKLVLNQSPNVQGGGSAGFPVMMAYFWMISLGVEPWIKYMERASPGMAMLILVVPARC